MNQEAFDCIVNNRIMAIKSIFTEKAKQYARGDRLSNFKKAASFRGMSPEDILMGLVIKHFTALDDYVQDLTEEDIFMPIEQWLEKIGDVINYMILLEALVMERHVNLQNLDSDSKTQKSVK